MRVVCSCTAEICTLPYVYIEMRISIVYAAWLLEFI